MKFRRGSIITKLDLGLMQLEICKPGPREISQARFWWWDGANSRHGNRVFLFLDFILGFWRIEH
jgi:hypothetical protein